MPPARNPEAWDVVNWAPPPLVEPRQWPLLLLVAGLVIVVLAAWYGYFYWVAAALCYFNANP